jgi:hypothetical protein
LEGDSGEGKRHGSPDWADVGYWVGLARGLNLGLATHCEVVMLLRQLLYPAVAPPLYLTVAVACSSGFEKSNCVK